MKHLLPLVTLLFPLLSMVGCGGTEAVSAGENRVACGCVLEEVGACGEYIEVEGEFVELTFPADMDLGLMPFCGRSGLTANATGEVVDEHYVCQSFELIEPAK